jgi:hypothetical protein
MDLSPPTAEALRRGREVVDRALSAHGGTAKLQEIKDSTVEGAITLYAAGQVLDGTQREMRREPSQLRIETSVMQVATVQTLDGDRAWTRVSAPRDSVVDENQQTVTALKAVYQSDPIHLLRLAAQPGTRLAWRGEEEVAARTADVVEMVSADSARSVLFFDRQQHYLVATEENHGSPLAGPVLRRVFGDSRTEQGIVVPHSEERLLNGERTLTLKNLKFLFNSGLDTMAFEKPGQNGSRPRRR